LISDVSALEGMCGEELSECSGESCDMPMIYVKIKSWLMKALETRELRGM